MSSDGRRLAGEGVYQKRALGTASWFQAGDAAGSEAGTDRVADVESAPEEAVDVGAELERFEQARGRARAEVRSDQKQVAATAGAEAAAVFDAHARFLDDPELVEAVEDAIGRGLVAEHAVQVALDDAIAEVGDRYATDLQDIRRRLLRVLWGRDPPAPTDLPPGSVVLAERLRPSDTVRLHLGRIAAIATVQGGRTAHASIVARSLGIPAVVGVGDALRDVSDGEEVLVDGCRGVVVVDPDGEAVGAAPTPEVVRSRPDPAVTTDGRRVGVAANAGTEGDVSRAVERGADGVGLFRTELLFMRDGGEPTEADLYEVYRSLLETFPDDRVVVRTLDLGGDKTLPSVPCEGGPLGARGVHRSLDATRDLFERQLRALLRASATAGGDVGVMFPMVASVDEFERAREVLRTVAASLADEGTAVGDPAVGTMVETPAAAMMAEELAERADFLSLGTNDLTQYVMAAARDDDAVADRHEPLRPPVLRAVDRAVSAARDADVPVTVCGEVAGEPSVAPLLVGLGVDELSVPPRAVPTVKDAVVATEYERVRDVAGRAVEADSLAAVHDLMEEL